MTPADLIPTIAPEFADVDTSAAIDVADMQIGPNLCGDKRPLLVAYLAAHILTIAGREGRSGGVSSLSEGGLSVAFGRVNPMGDSNLETTSYGAEYLRLSRGCVFAPRTRVTRV